MTAAVDCDGRRHRIEWRGGRLRALDHDIEAERTLVALGGSAPGCLTLVTTWDRREIDLVALLGRDGDHNPRREGLLRRSRSTLGRPGGFGWPHPHGELFWSLPARLRHRMVLAEAMRIGAPDDVIATLTTLEAGGPLDQLTFRRLAAALTQRRLDEDTDIAPFFDGERLVQMPAAAAKRRRVLERLARRFESDRDYPEREVNGILNAVHADHAALRRYLVDEGLLKRSHGIYRRTRQDA